MKIKTVYGDYDTDLIKEEVKKIKTGKRNKKMEGHIRLADATGIKYRDDYTLAEFFEAEKTLLKIICGEPVDIDLDRETALNFFITDMKFFVKAVEVISEK